MKKLRINGPLSYEGLKKELNRLAGQQVVLLWEYNGKLWSNTGVPAQDNIIQVLVEDHEGNQVWENLELGSFRGIDGFTILKLVDVWSS